MAAAVCRTRCPATVGRELADFAHPVDIAALLRWRMVWLRGHENSLRLP
jgi:hypothetical protein